MVKVTTSFCSAAYHRKHIPLQKYMPLCIIYSLVIWYLLDLFLSKCIIINSNWSATLPHFLFLQNKASLNGGNLMPDDNSGKGVIFFFADCNLPWLSISEHIYLHPNITIIMCLGIGTCVHMQVVHLYSKGLCEKYLIPDKSIMCYNIHLKHITL